MSNEFARNYKAAAAKAAAEAAKPRIEELAAAQAVRDAELARRAAKLGDTGVVPGKAHPIRRTNGGRTRRRFKKKRLMSRKYCKKTPCRRMGFTQKASCRPYKNCYTRKN